MRTRVLRAMYHRKPFVSIGLKLVGGRVLRVHVPTPIAIPLLGRRIVYVHDDGRFEQVSAASIRAAKALSNRRRNSA